LLVLDLPKLGEIVKRRHGRDDPSVGIPHRPNDVVDEVLLARDDVRERGLALGLLARERREDRRILLWLASRRVLRREHLADLLHRQTDLRVETGEIARRT